MAQSVATPVAFVFSGQGSQSVGMGAWLYETCPQSRRLLERADDVLGYPLSRLMRSGPERTLRNTEHAQPAILALSVALYQHARRAYRPMAAAGHSVGEYSALVAAESLEYEDAIRLVQLRGELMRDSVRGCRGGMLAVRGLEVDELRTLCAASERDGTLDLAALNAPRSTVVSGTADALRRLQKRLSRREVLCTRLRVSLPFHSRLLAPARNGFRSVIAGVRIQKPAFPILSNFDACAMSEPEQIRDRLVDQIVQPVRWADCLHALASLGAGAILEVGPGSSLLGSVKHTLPFLPRAAMDGPHVLRGTIDFFHGLSQSKGVPA